MFGKDFKHLKVTMTFKVLKTALNFNGFLGTSDSYGNRMSERKQDVGT
jgi:hypothetical protein